MTDIQSLLRKTKSNELTTKEWEIGRQAGGRETQCDEKGKNF